MPEIKSLIMDKPEFLEDLVRQVLEDIAPDQENINLPNG